MIEDVTNIIVNAFNQIEDYHAEFDEDECVVVVTDEWMKSEYRVLIEEE